MVWFCVKWLEVSKLLDNKKCYRDFPVGCQALRIEFSSLFGHSIPENCRLVEGMLHYHCVGLELQ